MIVAVGRRLSVTGDDRANQRERLADLRDFCQDTTEVAGSELMQRCKGCRAAEQE